MFVFRCSMLVLSKMQKPKTSIELRTSNIEHRTSNMIITNNNIYTQLNNGIQMPLLGLGVYDIYKKEAEQAVSWALDIGYRLIDTAAMYENEVEIGNAVRHSGVARNELFVTTKVHNHEQGYDKTRHFRLSNQFRRYDFN